MRKGFFPRLALSGIRKNRSIYYPYILTAVLTTAMMYIIGSLQQISTDYSGTLAFSLQLGIVVTSVFSVVFLFYTNSFLMRRRKRSSACITFWAWKSGTWPALFSGKRR